MSEPTEGDKPVFKDEDPIEFNFTTFGELARVFGPNRASNLVKIRERKLAQGEGSPALTGAEVEVAMKFIRGEKTGARTSMVLRVFRSYFATNARARKGFETYLRGLLSDDPAAE